LHRTRAPAERRHVSRRAAWGPPHARLW
jgi:hypothetical protein